MRTLEISKPRIRSKWRFVWVIPIIILVVTAIPKVIGMDFMIENMTNAGMGHMTFLVGVIELLCAIVFLIPRTRNIGFLLIVAYTGGIIAAEWVAHEPVIPGVLVMILMWIGMRYENPKFFQIRK
ncbi:hypothetical protein [Winogradskyella sp.]|uniref:hypothetical protein n=1 Tax=Winogradskyella sp. TaxID=1883156 RepID=UPI00261B6831|nr:hypothetical protein [Winogradskyella sp.]